MMISSLVKDRRMSLLYDSPAQRILARPGPKGAPSGPTPKAVPALCRLATALRWCGCGCAFLTALYAFQRPFHQYPGVEYFHFDTPSDANELTEFAFARLMFPGGPLDGYRGRFDGDWRKGLTLWTQDYPRADRHFSQAVRRLTRVHIRSVEQPINLEDGDEAYNWPWLYAVQVGEWGLTEE